MTEHSSESIAVAKELINKLKEEGKLRFLKSKFALFGVMRERATVTPKLYLPLSMARKSGCYSLQ